MQNFFTELGQIKNEVTTLKLVILEQFILTKHIKPSSCFREKKIYLKRTFQIWMQIFYQQSKFLL